MSKKYKVLNRARMRIDDIYDYTHKTWRSEQASRYLDGLFATFASIAAGATISRPIQAEYGVSGYYARYEKHFIYWKHLTDGTVGIAEILHERMNQGDHLAKSDVL